MPTGLHENDIAEQALDDLIFLHGRAAIFDDKRLAAEFLDGGQRLDEALGAGFGSKSGTRMIIRRGSAGRIPR